MVTYEKLRTELEKKDEKEEEIEGNKARRKEKEELGGEKRRVQRIEESRKEIRTEKKSREERRACKKATHLSSPNPTNMKWEDFINWVTFYTIYVHYVPNFVYNQYSLSTFY